jgi:bifunctional non-homologous end joining protein LigD
VPSRRASRKGGKDAPRAAKLGEYEAKRDFEATAEPSGKTAKAKRTAAPRFVIHEHSATRLHWDLRLERDGVLASWAVPKGLPEAPKDNRLAVWTEDHPLEYVDFHGEIPKGQYGAGTMTIWDQGTYDVLKWEPRKIEVALHGQRLDARYALFAIAQGEHPKEWMIHRMDPPADAAREPMPEHVKPMLARAGSLPRGDRGWVYEIKWDGVRAIAYSRPGELRLESRNLKEITAQYPELARLNRALSSHAAILDGEIVALDERGRPSFEALQRRMHVGSDSQIKRLAKTTPVTYMIFDLLWLDGHSLMELPYGERRGRLQDLALSGPSWQTPEPLAGRGRDVLAATAEQGLEGVVVKRLDAPYEPGARTGSWIKVKNVGRQEVVVGGWMPGEGRRRDRIGALLVGVYEPAGQLRYAGRVGTGFTESELDRLAKLLGPLQRDDSPFTAGERPPRTACFSEPELVAEVEFREWTKSGVLRQTSYKGLREDKSAREVVREDMPPPLLDR